MNQLGRELEIRLRIWLREQHLKEGDRLPGERELAQRLGVGRTVLRPVLEALEVVGILERRPQSGTILKMLPPPAGHGATLALIAPLGGPGDPPFLHRIALAFERSVVAAGAQLQIFDQTPFHEDPCSVKDLARQAIAAGVRAALLIHPTGSREKIACALTLLHDHGVSPLIVSARTYPGLANQIYFDSRWGAYLATRLLTERGHRRLGFVGGPTGHEWVKERQQGFLDALVPQDETERPAPWLWAPLGDATERLPKPEDGQAAFASWQALPEKTRPTGLFCANDVLALGLLQAARAAGVAVPQTLAVIGFDDDPGAIVAGLTTIERPTEALGTAAARIALERIASGADAAAVTHRLRPVLIERRTT